MCKIKQDFVNFAAHVCRGVEFHVCSSHIEADCPRVSTDLQHELSSYMNFEKNRTEQNRVENSEEEFS